MTDALGRETVYAYDELDRLISITEPDPDDTGALTSPVTENTYDAVGNLLTVTDPEANVTEYVYDGLHRLIEQIDPLDASTLFEYDAAGNLTQTTDREGRVSSPTTSSTGGSNVSTITEELRKARKRAFSSSDAEADVIWLNSARCPIIGLPLCCTCRIDVVQFERAEKDFTSARDGSWPTARGDAHVRALIGHSLEDSSLPFRGRPTCSRRGSKPHVLEISRHQRAAPIA